MKNTTIIFFLWNRKVSSERVKDAKLETGNKKQVITGIYLAFTTHLSPLTVICIHLFNLQINSMKQKVEETGDHNGY